MNPARDSALIDQLRAEAAETPWLEFKSNNTDPEMIGKRCSALANSARIEGRDMAYMVWGIEDESHAIIGTDFNPEAKKVGNQALSLWLGVCAAEVLMPESLRQTKSVTEVIAGSVGGQD